MTFALNKTLEVDSRFITDLELCQVRIMNNSNFPWIILVPKLEGIVEITDLDDTEYDQLNKEIRLVARAMQHELVPDKLNIATIGNIVSQLHVHVIGRYKDDALFPRPVWGHEHVKYQDAKLEDRVNSLRKVIDRQLQT